jgi:hypothetical protein
MAENIERAQSRLSNIRSVQPLLGALRTISLGSWQSSLKRQQNMKIYRRQFSMMLAALAPQLASQLRKQPGGLDWAPAGNGTPGCDNDWQRTRSGWTIQQFDHRVHTAIPGSPAAGRH